MNKVNFNFTVSLEDAHNIMETLNNARCDALDRRITAIVNNNEAEAKWFVDHAEYWKNLLAVIRKGTTPVEP